MSVLTAPATGGSRHALRRLRVVAVEQLTADVCEFVLADAGGSPLPSYTPGSHLVLHIEGGRDGQIRNAYSLTGSGIAPADYRVSVLRRNGGGGSDLLHDTLRSGSEIVAEGPVSAFAPDLSGTRCLLVAAGIGITPILSHLRAARAWGRPVELVYGYREESAAAHLVQVRALAGADLVEARGREALSAALAEKLSDQPWGTHVYTCGPQGVIEAVATLAAGRGWPEQRVHSELFEAAELDPGRPFEVTLARTGARLPVPSGTSLLDTLLDAGVDVAHMCRQGVCGQCVVDVRDGLVEHRDHVLSTAERDGHDVMLACVSRAAGAHLEVDL